MGEVYGTAFIETGRDKLKVLLDALITSMAADDPKISYAYDGHDTADIQLNGATVDFEAATWDGNYPNRPTIGLLWELNYSIRVHVAYIGGIMDGVMVSRLLNSVANKMFDNRDLGSGYRITAITSMIPDEPFNHTLGGSLSLTISKFVEHIQE